MSLNAREKLGLVKRAGQIKNQLREGVKAIERIKLMKELSEIWKKLGKGIAKDAGGDELPEIVRKFRDGELVTADIDTVIKAIEEAEKYLSLNVGLERSEEWVQHNQDRVQA